METLKEMFNREINDLFDAKKSQDYMTKEELFKINSAAIALSTISRLEQYPNAVWPLTACQATVDMNDLIC